MEILIIEDEQRAARQLDKLLKNSSFDFQILSVIDSIEEAVLWFKDNPYPDLIFMDIQLADGLSFEIFHKIEINVPIIFTTAFDQYAIRAFKVNSIDYLLKPIQQEDLNNALNKFNKSKPEVIEPLVLKELLNSLQTSKRRKGILVKEGNSFIQIQTSELAYIYSQTSITFGITLDNRRFIIDETLDNLFDSLELSEFYRINRGQIVMRYAIKKIEPYFNHRLKLQILNSRDLEFVVSRQKTTDFKEWLNS
ncbi:LytR/AlgR family response regulator transcription factor [Tenacibaculum sp. C7A-26P2]|uniref:LytR/AlgR family response regulator transcription factor n=1 Tax=Tenacibaculum sp. C7A-26P2 TaxID=3447504 RepID=UPI003F82C085